MLSKMKIKLVIFVIFMMASVYLYFSYKTLYKPWLLTEFTLMRIANFDGKTLASNNLDSFKHYYIIVKNPPYTLQARYQMVEDFLSQQKNLYPKTGNHLREYFFSQEGWNKVEWFPYLFEYVDRRYNNNPVAVEDDWVKGTHPKEYFPYGGGNGVSGKLIASFEIKSNSSECKNRTFTVIHPPFMSVNAIFKNKKYDFDDFGAAFYFGSGNYTLDTPECEGVVHEGDSTNKGLRF